MNKEAGSCPPAPPPFVSEASSSRSPGFPGSRGQFSGSGASSGGVSLGGANPPGPSP
jgi:hypothetical protein